MKLSDLQPNEHNPRTITEPAFAKLKESIQRDPEFMCLRPIVHDADGTILGGNMRWRACEALGMTEIPDDWAVEAKDLTWEQKRRFVLVDNAPEGMAGAFDFDLLANDWELPELEMVGLELPEIADFSPGTEEEQGKLDELAPKMVKCPECGYDFDFRGNEMSS